MKTVFQTKILGFGNNTGLAVPPENLAELGSSKKPPVEVAIGTYTYKSTVATMNGRFMIPLSKAHREAAGLAAGDAVTVTLTLDEGVREVAVPPDLQIALQVSGLTEVFAGLAYSKRKEHSRQVTDAKADETKQRRIAKIIASLKN